MKSLSRLLLILTAIGTSAPAFACSECGCSLSSDWAAQGLASTPGLELGLRYEYYEQSDLRSGTGPISRAALTFPNDREIQQRTVNRNTWLDLSYGLGSSWALALAVPYLDRFHTTIAEGDTEISTSQANDLGELRLVARYQRPGGFESYGFQFGLKLPTGKFDQTFADGPQAGEVLDRGLQLGTGTTDLLVGASWFGRPAPAWGAFAQMQFNQPLAARAGFLPGTGLRFNTGVRWLNPSRFTPQLQLNCKVESREHGANADTTNSGGAFAYVSPGLTAELGSGTSAFAFMQLPVYQRVNGLQLEPKWLLSVGMRWKI